MRVVSGGLLALCGVGFGLGGKHGHGGHEGGKKHESYGVGYVEEGGIVGYSCHEGWIPQGEGPGMVCMRKDKMPLLPQCPVGILEGAQCLLREPAIFSCPPGFVEVGGFGGKKKHGGHGGHGGKKEKHDSGPLCMKVDRVPFEAYCPGGSTLTSGQCMRLEIAPATMICPLENGGKKHGHGGHGGHEGKKHSYMQPACVETIDVPPVLTCPPMLTPNGNSCVGVGEGPCPQAPPTPLVFESGKKGKHGHSHGYRRLDEAGADGENIEVAQENIESGEQNIEIAQADIESGAENIEIAQADIESGEQNIEIAQAEAEAGEAGLEELRRLGEKEGKHGHHGYGPAILPPVPSKMKMCTLEIIEPAIPACPPGSFEANSYDAHKHKKEGKHGGHGNYGNYGGFGGLLCAQTVDVPLEPYCPMAGAVLRPDTMTCESRVLETELTKCPIGFEPCNLGGGKKEKHGHGGKKSKHGAGYGAPGCCAVQYADPVPGCPLGAQLLGASCVIANPPVFECPQGSIRDGEKCYLIQTKPPKIHYQINVTTKQAQPLIAPTHTKYKKHH